MPVLRARVVIHNSVLGGDGVNTWHLRTEDPIFVEAEANDRMEALGAYYAAIKNEHAAGTSFTFDGQLVRVDDESADIEGVTPWEVNSTTSQGTLPPSNCLVVGWGTSQASRSGHGRTFHGPMGTNSLDTDGTVESSTLSVFRDAAQALIDDSAATLNGAFGVWSREDQVLRDFVTRTVHDRFAILRSRRD